MEHGGGGVAQGAAEADLSAKESAKAEADLSAEASAKAEAGLSAEALAEAGMAEMSKRFEGGGGEIYLPVRSVRRS